jgi:hypothetical protein
MRCSRMLLQKNGDAAAKRDRRSFCEQCSRRANGGRVPRWRWAVRRFAFTSRQSDDAVLRARLRELATQRRRFGYRRLHILPPREGVVMNIKSSSPLP